VTDTALAPAASDAADRSARRLARFLTFAGVSHFVVPGFYEAIVPRWIGHEKAVVRWSGVVEIDVRLGVQAHPLTHSRVLGVHRAASAA
jgi:uncharacterized membrane protein